MVNKCKQIKKEYTRNNYNLSRHFNPSYLVSNLDELNIFEDSMENRLGLRYTTHIINFHCHQNGFYAVRKSTINLAFFRRQPKITRIQKIQQGAKNGGKWKEAIHRQTKQWLIMLNRLPEDKE